ncbi:MAG TPA: hypothetical protein VF914_18035 [Chloroflexia bacterium]
MPYQQNIGKRHIALVLLKAKSNSIESLQPLAPKIENALLEVAAGEVIRVGS